MVNLTGKTWMLTKTVTNQYVNNVLDTTTVNEKITQTEIYTFNSKGGVTLKTNALTSAMQGSWWFADGETMLSTDLILTSSPFSSYYWLANATIVSLSASQLVLRMPATTYEMMSQGVTRNYSIVVIKYFTAS
ncbi:MAG: hypothetical protein Q8861_12660 [Bacteroidota bacterium]|nr:hypothetical protein [Bacteroidota bacterium]